MSSTFTLDLSSASVGKAIADSFANLTGGISQLAVQNGQRPVLVLQNESGVGLTVTIQGSGITFQLPAGGWTHPIPLPLTATGISVNPLYSIAGGGVAILLGTVYAPGEPIVPIATLGNSPIGGTVSPVGNTAIENYLVSPGVVQGMVASKDVSIANQLDVTSGTAVVRQASGIIAVIVNPYTTFLTSIPNATYFLDLTSTGTYSFATSHSSDPNAIALWTVTTDGSGNISTVNAQGNYNLINIVPGASGEVQFGAGGAIAVFANGAQVIGGLGVSGAIGSVGNQPTAGTLGVPPVVASVYEQHITGTGAVTLITFTPLVNGLYRVSGFARVNNGTSGNNCKLQVTFFDPQKVGGSSDFSYMVGINGASGSGLQFGGSTSITNNPYAFEPQVFDQTGGKALTIAYTDPTNTPSDWLSIIVERLS